MSDKVALRGWKNIPFAFYMQGVRHAAELSAGEFFAMLLCDGDTDLEDSDMMRSLERRALIARCEKGDAPSEWSRYRRFDNIYIPAMNLMITGRCNFNCLHCFNAADNAPLMSEWDFDELCILLDQARDCGINAFTLTGGEPMMHPRFMDIVREIMSRGMYVDRINTNGWFITQELIDQMLSAGCRPIMKISFDGLGSHDKMRDHKDAERRTLEAIELCVKNGFKTRVQTQVNRLTLDSLAATLSLMEDMGVSEAKLIRTSESERWVLNAGEATLPAEEYYESMLGLAAVYARGDHSMDLRIWQFLDLYPSQRAYAMEPVMYGVGGYRGRAAVCRDNRSMSAISSDGELVPCLQMSGWFKARGMSLGNVHETELGHLLREGKYLDTICRTFDELRDSNSKCSGCRYFEYCCGGCRALGLLYSGERADMDGEDITKCLFFENGWYRRVEDAMKGWRNLRSIPSYITS